MHILNHLVFNRSGFFQLKEEEELLQYLLIFALKPTHFRLFVLVSVGLHWLYFPIYGHCGHGMNATRDHLAYANIFFKGSCLVIV